MKIYVLEWLSGGGLGGSECIDDALLVEGQAMLSCLAKNLALADLDVTIVMDERLPQLHQTISPFANIHSIPRQSTNEGLLGLWATLSRPAEIALVIAPELDRILTRAVQTLDNAGIPLANCTDAFLDLACDKLAMSQVLRTSGISHPSTCLHAELTRAWINQVHRKYENERWVIKPRDGAGCESVRRVSTEELSETLDAPRDQRMIVQPWITGLAASCSALVDVQGRWHWLPLVTQEFSGEGCPKYLGGELLHAVTVPHGFMETVQRIPIELGSTARGWVGVDLVYSDRQDDWFVIEVNPRCTTSLVGLQAAYSGNLAASLIKSQLPNFAGLTGSWQACRFLADGTTVV